MIHLYSKNLEHNEVYSDAQPPQQAETQQLSCWDDYDSKGNNVNVSDNVSDLDSQNFTDRIASCCFSGG